MLELITSDVDMIGFRFCTWYICCMIRVAFLALESILFWVLNATIYKTIQLWLRDWAPIT